MDSEKLLQYENYLNQVLLEHYIALTVAVLLLIGWIVFVIWYMVSDRKYESVEVSNNTKINPVVATVAAVMIGVAFIAVFFMIVTSLRCVRDDLSNQAYVVVDTEFEVVKIDWWGRWNSDTYTVLYEENGINEEINPEKSFVELSVGTYTDTILVYAQKSEIVLDMINNETGDSLPSPR